MRIREHRWVVATCVAAMISTTAMAQQYQNPLDQRPVKARRSSASVTATPRAKTAAAATPVKYQNPLDLRPRAEEVGSGNGRTALDRRPKGVAPLRGDDYSFPAKATPPPNLAPEITRQSTLRAAEKHPDLAVSGSAFNQRFTDAVTILQSSSPEFFRKGDWPEQLADRIAVQLDKEATAPEQAKGSGE